MSTALKEDDPLGRALVDPEEALQGLRRISAQLSARKGFSLADPNLSLKAFKPKPTVSSTGENDERHFTDQSRGG